MQALSSRYCLWGEGYELILSEYRMLPSCYDSNWSRVNAHWLHAHHTVWALVVTILNIFFLFSSCACSRIIWARRILMKMRGREAMIVSFETCHVAWCLWHGTEPGLWHEGICTNCCNYQWDILVNSKISSLQSLWQILQMFLMVHFWQVYWL